MVDEYGGVIGLVTMKALLGQIFGHIRSLSSAAPMQGVVHLEDEGIYVLDAEMRIHDFNREFGAKLSNENAKSLAGLILHRCGELPAVNMLIDVKAGRFCVAEIENNRITKILFSRDPDQELSADLLANNNDINIVESKPVENEQQNNKGR